jgi:threonylcarbamoyladenosine tRNA methylthiotransferase MtaB
LPHFHIPLQSGCNQILAKMKRRYNTEFFAKKIEEIKSKMPDCFIGIDLIVGFPNETDENFEETYNFLQKINFSYLHLFPYSERPNTESSKIKEKVNSKIINLRMQILQQLSDKKFINFYNQNIGKQATVLFESSNYDGKIHGFTENYIKVETNFDKNLINEIKIVKLLNINENGNMNIVLNL